MTGRKPIFDCAMTPAERQRRHREKKRRERANPELSIEEVLAPFVLEPGEFLAMCIKPDELEELLESMAFKPGELEALLKSMAVRLEDLS